MTKILYSPGYGAGWSTWMDDDPEFQKFVLTYQPIIEFLEGGGKIPDPGYETSGWKNLHPVLTQFLEDVERLFPDKHVYIGGADDLQVYEVNGPFRIEEYDGYESVIEDFSQKWIVL